MEESEKHFTVKYYFGFYVFLFYGCMSPVGETDQSATLFNRAFYNTIISRKGSIQLKIWALLNENGKDFIEVDDKIKSKQTSIATVRNHLRTFASRPSLFLILDYL
jgi:hypothetical protein